MKDSIQLFIALILSLAIISLNGCTDYVDVAMKSTRYDKEKGIDAVHKLNNQSELAKVAIEAINWEVQNAAIEKVTDQSLLVKIALEAENASIYLDAISKLTDKSIVGKIAVEAKSYGSRSSAIRRLNDQALLAKIALDDKDLSVRYAAFRKLTDTDLKEKTEAKLNDIDGDMRDRIFSKLIIALESIPNLHRSRIFNGIKPAIDVLIDTEVVNIVGEIVSVSADWSSRNRLYSPDGLTFGGSRSVPGEWFKCSIKVKNLANPLSHAWLTEFQEKIVYTESNRSGAFVFRGASINAADLLEPVLALLSQYQLGKISVEAKSIRVREAAVEKLTEKFLLSKNAVEDEQSNVSKAAFERLTNQSLLAVLAKSANNPNVRKAAMEKLTDQSLIASCAMGDMIYLSVREAAVEKLTDKSLLAKIASEDKDRSVSATAQRRLEVLRRKKR